MYSTRDKTFSNETPVGQTKEIVSGQSELPLSIPWNQMTDVHSGSTLIT